MSRSLDDKTVKREKKNYKRKRQRERKRPNSAKKRRAEEQELFEEVTPLFSQRALECTMKG